MFLQRGVGHLLVRLYWCRHGELLGRGETNLSVHLKQYVPEGGNVLKPRNHHLWRVALDGLSVAINQFVPDLMNAPHRTAFGQLIVCFGVC